MDLMDREDKREEAIKKNREDEQDIVVVRKWHVRAKTPVDAILKTIGIQHDEVDAWVERKTTTGPGGYIPF